MVAHGDPGLPREERHVGIEREVVLADQALRQPQRLGVTVVQQTGADDPVDVLFGLEAIEGAAGTHQHVAVRPRFIVRTGSETGRDRGGDIRDGGERGEPGPETLRHRVAATDARAEHELLGGGSLSVPIQDPLENRLPGQHVLGEDPVHGLAIDPLVFHRHLARLDHADDRLPAAAAGAADLVQFDIVAAGRRHVLAEFFGNVERPGGMFAGRRSDLDTDRRAAASRGHGIPGPLYEYSVISRHSCAHLLASRTTEQSLGRIDPLTCCDCKLICPARGSQKELLKK